MLEVCKNCYYSGPMNPEEEYPEYTDPLECRKPINAVEKIWPKIWPIVESDFSCLNFKPKKIVDCFTLQGGISGYNGNGINPADNKTYYVGPLQNTSMTDLVVLMLNHFVVPKKCTLKKAYIISTVQGTIASTEGSTLTLRKNNATNTLITDAIMCSIAFERILITDLNIALEDQDYFELLWKTPAWVTNPTAVRLTIVLYFE